MDNKMKVFQFNIDGEREYVAASNPIKAISLYMDISDIPLCELTPDGVVVELDDDEINNSIYQENGEPVSIRESIIRNNIVDEFFFSTNWASC